MAYIGLKLYGKIPEDRRKEIKKINKPSQNNILKLIENKGYSLSKNFYSEFGVSPVILNDMLNYEQIELPTYYAGVKTFYLGYALNNLIAYAGKYNCFFDLFGGSASATMAVTQQDDKCYFINELDYFNINYYRVIADDDLYKMFKEELQKVIISLKDVDCDKEKGKEFFEKCEDIEKSWRGKYPINNILNDYNYNKEDDKNKIEAAVAYVYIHSFQISGGKHEKGAVSAAKLNSFCNYNEAEFDKFHIKMKRLDYIFCLDVLSGDSKVIDSFSDKSLIYSDSPYLNTEGYKAGGIDKDKMHLLIDRLIASAKKGNNFIFSCRATKTILQNTYYNWDNMIGFETLKKDEDNNVVLCGRQCSSVIPYIDENGNFKEVKRVKEKLESFGKMLYENYEIYKNVFEYFQKKEDEDTQLYVLVCIDEKNVGEFASDIDEKGVDENDPRIIEKKLKGLIKYLYTVEVFITNFDFVVPLRYSYTSSTKEDDKGLDGEQDYTFAKYTIQKFDEILKESLWMSKHKYVIQSCKINTGEMGYHFVEE